jgi:hypothetical protein
MNTQIGTFNIRTLANGKVEARDTCSFNNWGRRTFQTAEKATAWATYSHDFKIGKRS